VRWFLPITNEQFFAQHSANKQSIVSVQDLLHLQQACLALEYSLATMQSMFQRFYLMEVLRQHL
jgi:hypothetical protein